MGVDFKRLAKNIAFHMKISHENVGIGETFENMFEDWFLTKMKSIL